MKLDLDKLDPKTHGLRGYAAVFGVRDDYGTIVDRGAFREEIRAFESGAESFPAVYAHSVLWSSTAKPLGVVTKIHEDGFGLYFESLLADTQEARDILQLVAMGAIAGASFSFDVLGWEEDDDEVTHFTKLRLYELGPCCWGANPEAYSEVYELDSSDDEQAADDEADDEELAAALAAAAEEIAA